MKFLKEIEHKTKVPKLYVVFKGTYQNTSKLIHV